MVRVSASVKRAPARRGSSGWGRVGAAPGWATGVGRRGGAVSRSGQFTQARHEPVERKCNARSRWGCSTSGWRNTGLFDGYEQQFKPWARSEDGKKAADFLSFLSAVTGFGSFIPGIGVGFFAVSLLTGAASALITCANGFNAECGWGIVGIASNVAGVYGKSVSWIGADIGEYFKFNGLMMGAASATWGGARFITGKGYDE